jgi:hypothetical protein
MTRFMDDVVPTGLFTMTVSPTRAHERAVSYVITHPSKPAPTPKPAPGAVTATWILQLVDLTQYQINDPEDEWQTRAYEQVAPTLKDAIIRTVKDICAHWKPGEDLTGTLRAGIALLLWGAGWSPDDIQGVGDAISELHASSPADLDRQVKNMIFYDFVP